MSNRLRPWGRRRGARLAGRFRRVRGEEAGRQSPRSGSSRLTPAAPRKITKKIDKPMAAAQKAFNAKKWDEVLAKVAEAEAVPVEKSAVRPVLDPRISRHRAYLSLKKYAEAAKELEVALDSPCMDDADKPVRTKLLMQIAYQLKEYPKVIELGNKYARDQPGS